VVVLLRSTLDINGDWLKKCRFERFSYKLVNMHGEALYAVCSQQT